MRVGAYYDGAGSGSQCSELAVFRVFDPAEPIHPRLAPVFLRRIEQTSKLFPVKVRDAPKHGLVFTPRRLVPDQTEVSPADRLDKPAGGARSPEPGGDEDIRIEDHARRSDDFGIGHREHGSITGLLLLCPLPCGRWTPAPW